MLHHCGRYLEPKSVIVIDNASWHHLEKMLQMCRDARVVIEFLPLYSLDFNPTTRSLTSHQTFHVPNSLFADLRMLVVEGFIYNKISNFTPNEDLLALDSPPTIESLLLNYNNTPMYPTGISQGEAFFWTIQFDC